MEMQTGEAEGNGISAPACESEIYPQTTQYYTPECESTLKPFEGQTFATVADGIDFYKQYAGVVGFDVRQTTMKRNREGKIRLKYLVCNREGYKNDDNPPTDRHEEGDNNPPTQKKRRLTNRVGCKARMVMIRKSTGKITVSIFDEQHNHRLCSEISKQFLKVNRNLDIGHQMFLVNCMKANIGPIKSHRLCKEMAGSFADVGATSVDFHNFIRDWQAHINEPDAQLLIDKFIKKKQACPGFYFDYDIDEQQHLNRVFWADPTARRSYTYFGDVVSFDATYSTNGYKLVFVPFTRVDNHKRCITFAAGLLTKEDIQSYEWLLVNSKKAMGNAPNYIITDQDPAIKAAVGNVFPATRYHFCMWHIMTKVGEKVGPVLAKDLDFRSKLNTIVWNEGISPNEFEVKWQGLMEEYGLVESKWFCQMFELRSLWIPAYFQDLVMSGLVRTTSRSEGENSMFGRFFSQHSILVEFIMHYESAIDAQRHEEAKLNAACEGHYSKFKATLLIECHAAAQYTVTIFHEVQTEIEQSCFSCSVVSIQKNGQTNRYEIKGDEPTIYYVYHDPETGTTTCTCGMFTRIGLLCHHIFLIYKTCGIERIPPQYIKARWTRKACIRPILHMDDITDDQNATNDKAKTLRTQLWSEIHSCMGLVGMDDDHIEKLTQILREHKQALMSERGQTKRSKSNKEVIEELCGAVPATNVTIRPPKVAKNKGSGKRIKGKREIAIIETSKRERRCHKCDQYGHHDSRNCTNV